MRTGAVLGMLHSDEQAALQAERLMLLSELRKQRTDILSFAHDLSGSPTLVSGWLEIEIGWLRRIEELLRRLHQIEEKIDSSEGR